MATNEEKLEEIVDAMNMGDLTLSKWEQDFIDSVVERIGDEDGLSERQQEIFDEIWERV